MPNLWDRVFSKIMVFSRKDEICVSIGAKPQLHRFSLGRFAARAREISLRETYRPSRPSSPPRRSSTYSSSRMTTPQDTSAECTRVRPWFFLVFSLSVAVSVTCTRAHVYTSCRFFIPLGHVYPREGNVRRKENVSPRCRQILSRSRRWRNGSYTMAEKRGTKYLICGRTELAPFPTKCIFHLVYTNTIIIAMDLAVDTGWQTRWEESVRGF